MRLLPSGGQRKRGKGLASQLTNMLRGYICISSKPHMLGLWYPALEGSYKPLIWRRFFPLGCGPLYKVITQHNGLLVVRWLGRLVRAHTSVCVWRESVCVLSSLTAVSNNNTCQSQWISSLTGRAFCLLDLFNIVWECQYVDLGICRKGHILGEQ